jgi:hypothetical protein
MSNEPEWEPPPIEYPRTTDTLIEASGGRAAKTLLMGGQFSLLPTNFTL